jgi:hypothetical protein
LQVRAWCIPGEESRRGTGFGRAYQQIYRDKNQLFMVISVIEVKKGGRGVWECVTIPTTHSLGAEQKNLVERHIHGEKLLLILWPNAADFIAKNVRDPKCIKNSHIRSLAT